MAESIIVAVLALVGTLAGSWMSNQKTQWRIDKLEEKVDKHNSVIERFAVMENDEKNQWKRIDELRADLEEMKKEYYHEQ